ncbi:na+/H+ exchanger, Cation/H+ exchanger, Cation/H+ exchanger, CPA1 family [Artemisia annua]|uniref:Na+/H+ exchanger, Cation/H+ exchanger, Cation/H+ exchanger, CPA1 family n=1 Tax=Artemisia annua TaxID=35608 RepID=A0A2U1NLQ6_ARTAN|nr:na+/H+ exchanger, Cation/H+ exchanger, Cation/H+ exchanger, CPA1 family [Artemisia annua]
MIINVNSMEASVGLLTSEPESEFVHHIALFAALLCACIVIGHLLEESRWMNESITALAIGLGTGCVILLTSGGKSSHILEFKQEFFFIYLLPPIIFNAGFQVKKKHFFENFTTITSFGAIGTLISFSIISFGATRLFPKLGIDYLGIKDYLALGAIFSATDSVCTLQVLNQEETPLLYSLVFGEGVVNDASSVVLFNAITKFDLSDMNSLIALKFAGKFFSLFVLSTLLGILVGLLCSYIIRTLYFGSVSILLTGGSNNSMLTFRNSTDREVSLMILMAYLSYVLAEVTVWWAGLMRGAVSVALAYKKFTGSDEQPMQPANALLITSTIIIVLFSTVVFGLLTKHIINFLFPQSHVDHTQPTSPKSIMMPLLRHGHDAEAETGDNESLPTTTNLQMLFSNPTNTIHHYWRKFDDAFMRPVFGGRGFISYVTGTRELALT